jgi:hypothetical protein
VATTTSDVTGATTLYYTPDKSGALVTYNGTVWAQSTTPEISLVSPTLTNAKNYDVFVACSTSTSCALSLSSAWTNDTTRADALDTQDGVAVLSSDHTQLHVCTLRASATNTMEDSEAKRFLSNRYNRKMRALSHASGTNQWSGSGVADTWRQANADSANQVDLVTATADIEVRLAAYGTSSNNTNTQNVGVGISSTTVNSAQILNGTNGSVTGSSGQYRGYPGLGRYYFAWLEREHGGGTVTWYGNISGMQNGLIGEVHQ